MSSSHLPHLAVTNVKSSSLERKATFTCLLYADAEIAVAATKSFAAEVALLYLLANALRPAGQLVDEIDQVIAVINDIFARKEELIPIAKELLVPNGYFLGHGNGWIGAKEAALKAKEIGYIHIESLSCSEFKHGPIALLEKDFPVVLWASNASEVGFLRQSQEETKSRLGKAITILPRSQANPTDNFAFGDAPAPLSVIPLAVIGDCLALLIALEKGLAIDKPRNLAKSVTV